MNFTQLQNELRVRVREAAEQKFGVTLDEISAETPPRTELGDAAFPVAFEIAKRVRAQTGEKRPPRQIAEELKSALEATEGVERVEVAGAGYINVFFDRVRLLAKSLAEPPSPPYDNKIDALVAKQNQTEQNHNNQTRKIIVEHTNINPNKAAHIGHLRNAVLGDTFVRCLRATGEDVEVHNYIDNTGVQVADVVVGFEHIEKMSLADVQQLDQSLPEDRPFDFYCWDLYAKVGLFYRDGDAEAKENPEKLKLRADALRAIEAGDNPTAALADYVATRVVERHLDTMWRLGIIYDVLPRESEILHFTWERAFERLKQTGAIRFETEGRNAGCWVMPIDAHQSTDEHEPDKVIVRSNGTITYTGKDIAYQLWKLGKLDANFYFRPFRTYPNGHTLWVTTGESQTDASDSRTVQSSETVGQSQNAPQFGGGSLVYNVIDSRQSYTQDVVRRGVAATAPEAGEEASVHLSYEMVALSPAASVELGLQLSDEDKKRSHIEMSGRKGLGVKADDLIDRLEADALREVETRHAEIAPDENKAVARDIAIGALRYFLLKWTRTSVIAFDFKEALSLEGESGAYCQYTAVRLNSLLAKIGASDSAASAHKLQTINVANEDAAAWRAELTDDVWSLISLALRTDEFIKHAAESAEPSHLARYAFQLARAFNLFYHHHRIIAEENQTRRQAWIAVSSLVRQQFARTLEVLGIPVPARM